MNAEGSIKVFFGGTHIDGDCHALNHLLARVHLPCERLALARSLLFLLSTGGSE